MSSCQGGVDPRVVEGSRVRENPPIVNIPCLSYVVERFWGIVVGGVTLCDLGRGAVVRRGARPAEIGERGAVERHIVLSRREAAGDCCANFTLC